MVSMAVPFCRLAGLLGLVLPPPLGATAGAIGAIIASWGILKKPDLSMALNGLLAGLVGITANADVITVTGALWIGLIAGFIVGLDHLRQNED